MKQRDAEPIGRAEIARKYGVTRECVRRWTVKGQLPEPDYPAVNGFPAWEADRVRTNRLGEETADPTPRCTPVGTVEIAELFGVTLNTARTWKNSRNLLPKPDHNSINGQCAWEMSTILKWADDTGRTAQLPEDYQR